MSKRRSKKIRKQLRAQGVRRGDPDLQPRLEQIGSRTVAVPRKMIDSKLTSLADDMIKTEFVNVPLFRVVNPYKRLVRAMEEGTFTSALVNEMRSQNEAQSDG